MSPGNRVDSPHDRDVVDVARSPVQSSSPSASSSGSPSMITVASDSMVGWRNATVAVSVTPVRSSISLAIATASRDDRPNSTIGTDSSTASGACPVALATQLRSHSRISGTDMSLRGGQLLSGASVISSGAFSGVGDSDMRPHVVRRAPRQRPTCRTAPWSAEGTSFSMSFRFVREGVGHLPDRGCRQVGRPAGTAADLAAGGARDRAGRGEQRPARSHRGAPRWRPGSRRQPARYPSCANRGPARPRSRVARRSHSGPV